MTCRCVRDALAGPHPFPELLEEPVAGLYTVRADAPDLAREAHDEWLDSACPHPLMQIVSEVVWTRDEHDRVAAAVAGMASEGRRAAGAFVDLVEALHPPPPWPATRAAQLQESLDWVRSHLCPIEVHQVIDEASGSVLHEASSERLYCTTGEGYQLGVCPAGILVTRRGERITVTDRLLQQETAEGCYRLTDPRTGAIITAGGAFVPYDAENPERHAPLPRVVVFRTVACGVEALEFALAPLSRLARASRTTGHSILWWDEEEQGW